jgi:hypothetical protein
MTSTSPAAAVALINCEILIFAVDEILPEVLPVLSPETAQNAP